MKDFARQQLSAAPSYNVMVSDPDADGGVKQVRYRDKYPCPPYKIVVLDEADSMTQDAQSALRRTMETYSKMTRFCLVCNYVTRIIDPLASRCSKFRFKSLDQGSAVSRVSDIARLEGVRMAPGVSEELVRIAEGDLRKAITFLQSAARLVGTGDGQAGQAAGRKRKMVDDDGDEGDGDEMDIDQAPNKPAGADVVTLQIVQDIAGVIPPPTMDVLESAVLPKSSKAIPYAQIAKVVEDMVADGWSAAQMVSQDRKSTRLNSSHWE